MEDNTNVPRSKVNCEKHGISDYCLICLHLKNEYGLKYYACEAEGEYPAQAWCESCDQILEQEQGWSDRADEAADWKLFCEGCYIQTLAQHEFVAYSVGTDDV